jgi:hypothetical protein
MYDLATMPLKCPAKDCLCPYKGCTIGYCRLEATRDPGRKVRKSEDALKRYVAEAMQMAEK